MVINLEDVVCAPPFKGFIFSSFRLSRKSYVDYYPARMMAELTGNTDDWCVSVFSGCGGGGGELCFAAFRLD